MLYGIDVSEYVTDIDPVQLRLNGCKFGSVKCSDAVLRNGVWVPFEDKKHLVFTGKFRSQAIPTQSYCFCHPSMDGKTLMDFFKTHGFYDQLLPALDLESLSQGKVPVNAGPWTKAALDYFEGITGVRPVVYASTSYMREMIRQEPTLKTEKIWIAEYHTSGTADSPPKPEFHYVAWQFAGDVKLDGCTGLVDRDVIFADDLSQLYVKDPQL